jgi:maltose phosphorylase
MAKVADKYLVVDPWKIIEEGFHPDRSRVSESLFSLGNEHQGVRGFFDEGFSGESLTGVYLNGIYEERFVAEPVAYKGISNRLCFMVNTVNWLHTRMEMDGEILDLAKSGFSDFRRELDFRSGELRREFVWEMKSGKRLQVVFSRLLSMETKELAWQRISLTPLNFSGKMALTLGLDFSIQHSMFGKSFWSCPRKGTEANDLGILGVSENIGHRLFAGFKAYAHGKQTVLESENSIGVSLEVDLAEGRESTVSKAVIVHSDRNLQQALDDAWQAGMSQLQAVTKTYEEVYKDNLVYWEKFWANSDITIDGDADTQQGIRFCIFQMQQTYRGVIDGANIGAKGLTGEAYNGNAFWDTETYCLPFYLFSNPSAAKSLIDFRYKTLPQALERAKDLDCNGACYPIATIDGTESCTLWQHASLQFQPTTAVAYAIEHYVNVTGDREFLKTEGAEMLIQICRFLASRGQWSQTGKFGYYAVMGPDEFQMMVNNNAYTNYMAKRTFEFALQVLTGMDLKKWRASSAELDEWRGMAEKMFIPYDEKTLLYEQHEGFFNLPHIAVDAIPVEDFPLYHHWSYDRIYRNDMIKQPDVLMFMFVYNGSFSMAEKQANYDYYEPRCIHESSLSPSVHSILAAELGKHEEAFDFFRFATRIDLDNYNRNTGEGIHTTSIAAAWMNIVYGFGGMRSDGELLSFKPSIPAHWKGYSFQVFYRGSVIRVEVSQTEAKLRIVEGGDVSIKINHQEVTLGQEGISISIKERASIG